MVGVDRAHGDRGAEREARLLVHAHVQAKGPVALSACELALVRALQPVAHELLVVALQQRGRARDRRVGGIEGVGLHVAVVAQGVVHVERVLELQRIRHTPLRHRAQPLHALLVHPVGAVVVLEARGRVDGQRAHGGVEHRCAPVRAVHVVPLVFVGQCVREAAAQVGQQRGRQLGGLCSGAFDPAACVAVVEVDARVVRRTCAAIAACNAAVQAYRHFLQVVGAQAQLALGEVAALGRLGDVVDGAAHAARSVQKTRRAADGLDPVVDPAIDRACGAAVLRVDAVVQLRDRVAGEAPVVRGHGARRVVRHHARHGAQDFLRVLCAACVDGGAIHHGDGGRVLARRQAQAAAGVHGCVQVQLAVGGCGGVHHVHGLERGRGGLGRDREGGQCAGGEHAPARRRKRQARRARSMAGGGVRTGHENALVLRRQRSQARVECTQGCAVWKPAGTRQRPTTRYGVLPTGFRSRARWGPACGQWRCSGRCDAGGLDGLQRMG